jgi:tetratricopeptide (TPR) repeat protein
MAARDLPELRRARGLWAAERREEALKLFVQTARDDPRNPYALIDAARASGQWFAFDEMEEYLDRLLKLSTRKGENRLQVAMTYRMNYRPAKAIPHLERVATSKRTAFLAALELAVIHERAGDLESAQQRASHALRELPGNPEATLVLARALSRDEREDEALRLLSSIEARRASETDPDTMAATMALRARIHEQRGEFKEAFACAERSNETLRPLASHLPADVKKNRQELFGLVENLRPAHVEKLLNWQPPDGRKNVCLMASFPRSGTTLLETMLGSHPQVEAADELPVYVNRLLNPLAQACGGSPSDAPDRFDDIPETLLVELRKAYLGSHARTLDASLDDKLLLDKNPSLTISIPMFLRVFPEIKLLIPLRDPRDVILSCFFQYLPVNPVSVEYLNLESAAESFARVMQHWVRLRRILPESCWQEVRYEDLVVSSRQELSRTLEFLGLPWSEDTISYFDRDKVTIHNAPTYADVKQPPHKKAVGRWENYADRFTPLRPILEPIMKELGYCW